MMMRPSSGRGDGAVGAGTSTVPSDGAHRSLGEAAHTDAGCTSFTQGHRPPKRGSPVCGVDVDLRHLHFTAVHQRSRHFSRCHRDPECP